MKTDQLSFTDDRLGELRAPARRQGRRDWRNWQGRFQIPGQARATSIGLSGNSDGPWPGLIAEVYRVLDALGPIRAKLDAELARRSPRIPVDAFEVAVIGDWDEHDEILQIEFAPRVSPGPADAMEVLIYWPEDDWALNHHLRINRTIPERRAHPA